jgi:hypothetical protein
MPPSSGSQRSSLKDYPEIAVAIAEFLSGFNSMEMLLHGLVSQILYLLSPLIGDDDGGNRARIEAVY